MLCFSKTGEVKNTFSNPSEQFSARSEGRLKLMDSNGIPQMSDFSAWRSIATAVARTLRLHQQREPSPHPHQHGLHRRQAPFRGRCQALRFCRRRCSVALRCARRRLRLRLPLLALAVSLVRNQRFRNRLRRLRRQRLRPTMGTVMVRAFTSPCKTRRKQTILGLPQRHPPDPWGILARRRRAAGGALDQKDGDARR